MTFYPPLTFKTRLLRKEAHYFGGQSIPSSIILSLLSSPFRSAFSLSFHHPFTLLLDIGLICYLFLVHLPSSIPSPHSNNPTCFWYTFSALYRQWLSVTVVSKSRIAGLFNVVMRFQTTGEYSSMSSLRWDWPFLRNVVKTFPSKKLIGLLKIYRSSLGPGLELAMILPAHCHYLECGQTINP